MVEEDVLGKAYDARLMRRLVMYLLPYWRAAALALVAILASAALQLVPPYLTRQAIDVSIPSADLAGLRLIAAAAAPSPATFSPCHSRLTGASSLRKSARQRSTFR